MFTLVVTLVFTLVVTLVFTQVFYLVLLMKLTTSGSFTCNYASGGQIQINAIGGNWWCDSYKWRHPLHLPQVL